MRVQERRQTRCRARVVAAAAALLALLVARTAAPAEAPPRVSLSLALSPCADTPQLADDLQRTALDALRDRSDLELRVTSPRPDFIRVQLLVGPDQQLRESAFTLSSPLDCRELPKMLGLLLQSWLVEDSWLQSPEQVTTHLASLAPPPPPRPPAATPAPASIPSTFGVVAQAGGFFAMGGPGSGPWLAGALERRLTPAWGAAVTLSYEGAIRLSALEGSLSVDTWTLAARARATLKRDGDSALDVLFGPGLRVLNAHATGFERNFSPTLLDPVLSLSARLQQRVAGRVSVLAGLGLEVCGARDVLRIARPDAAVDLGRVRFNLAVGLAIPLD